MNINKLQGVTFFLLNLVLYYCPVYFFHLVCFFLSFIDLPFNKNKSSDCVHCNFELCLSSSYTLMHFKCKFTYVLTGKCLMCYLDLFYHGAVFFLVEISTNYTVIWSVCMLASL